MIDAYYARMYNYIYTDGSWKQFCQTRDWYDLPGSIESNDWIYKNIEAIQRTPYLENPDRFFIYPKDIEVIYDCTPEAARNFLDDIRQSLDLPISGPVTYYDLRKYTGLDWQTILDFIMES
jgi:hypothetical protein